MTISSTIENTDPRNVETERALLGALLRNNNLYESVSETLIPEHFYEQAHADVWRLIVQAMDNRKSATVFTIGQHVDKAVLSSLCDGSPSPTTREFRDWAAEIAEQAARRGIVEVCRETIEEAVSAPWGTPPTEMVAAAEAKLFRLTPESANGGPVRFNIAMEEALAEIDAAQQDDDQSSYITTGLIDLDAKLGKVVGGQLVILAGRPAMGKAQALDAKIMTPTGWTTMGNLKVGDALASVDGMASEVTAIHPQGQKQIYRVTFSDGRSTECCAEHLWRVTFQKWGQPRVVSTEELIRMLGLYQYKGRLSIDLVTGDFGHNDDVPVDPYVLGVLIGNGSIIRNLRLSSNDKETVSRFRELLPDGTEMVYESKYDYRVRGIKKEESAGGREAILSLLEKIDGLGLRGTRSHDKFIPDAYKTANKHVREELLAGLLDTDGWVEAWGTVRYSTSSRKLAEDVTDLVRSLGGMCQIKEKTPFYTYKGERKRGKTHFVCCIRHDNGGDLFRLPRKADRAVGGNRRCRLTISSIVPTRITEAQCISVSHPQRTYVTDDYIVTHNTALAKDIAEHNAAGGKNVAFFSMEMQRTELAKRKIAKKTGISLLKMREKLSREDYLKVSRATTEIQAENLPVFIDHEPNLTLAQVRARARRLHRKEGLSLIVIDYLEMMADEPHMAGSPKNYQIGCITKGLKGLAKELNVPVILLVQVNRKVEDRDDKRPHMSDLKDSGNIEQDADIIMFVFREEVYLKKEKPVQGEHESSTKFDDRLNAYHIRLRNAEGIAEILIEKNRSGEAPQVARVQFDGLRTTFGNLYK